MGTCRSSIQTIGAILCALGATLALGSRPASGTVVERMDLETMADHAVVVVISTVATVESYWSGNPRRIESRITLSQTEYLKGSAAGGTESLTIVVPGGTVGTMTMAIAGAPTFDVGQRWLLMLRSTYKTFPVVGLMQGAFRIVVDETGVRRVANAAGEPIIEIDAAGFVRARSHHQANGEFPSGMTDGTHIATTGDDESISCAISCDDFRDALQPILDRSRLFESTAPVARRIAVTFTPTTLKRAPRATSDRTSIDPPAGPSRAAARPAMKIGPDRNKKREMRR